MTEILLYCEDRLLEAIGMRIARHVGLVVRAAKITHGRVALERQLPQLNRAAAHRPVLVLLDRDGKGECPGAEVERLVPGRHPALHLRLAVEEADAWLLADREGFAAFLGLSPGRLPNFPERERDPKQTLLTLARKARSREKRRIAPEPGMTARIGPEYNALLCGFVGAEWSIDRARLLAPSLDRCLAALGRLGQAAPG